MSPDADGGDSGDEPASRSRPALLAALGAAALVALATAAALDYARHGWSARYFASDGAGRFLVHDTVEHRGDFPNGRRPLARYVQHWDYARQGVPAALPRLDLELRATLEVPQDAPRRLRVKTFNDVTLAVDGASALEPELAPGSHALGLSWAGDPLHAQLRLRWQAPGGEWEEVPRRALTPLGGTGGLRVAVAAAGAAAMLATAALLFAGLRAPRPRRARLLGVLAAGWILALGAGFRLYDYDVMPDFRENLDELSAAWNGWQMLSDGTTRGWSLWHTLYPPEMQRERIAYFDPAPLRVMVPFFDHPPLFHLLVGAAAKLGGAGHWSHARLHDTRLVPIALSLLTLWLLLALGRRLEPDSAAPYLAALLFACTPTIALQSRAVKEDALLVPLLLGALLLFLRWRESARRRDWLGAALLAGLGVLAKEVGAVFVAALALLVWQRGARRQALLVALAGAAVASLLLLHGALGGFDAFLEAHRVQGVARGVRYDQFLRFFTAGMVNQNWIGQGFLVFLWSAYLVSLGARGREPEPVLVLPPFLYVIALGAAAGSWHHGWFALPLYPFLCLGGGRLLADLWRRPGLLRASLFVLLAVFYALEFSHDPDWAARPDSFPLLRTRGLLLCAGLLGPQLLFELVGGRWPLRLARAATAVAIAVFVAASAVMVARYDVLYDRFPDFDRIDYLTR